MNLGTLYVFYNGDLLLVVEEGEPRLALDRLEQEALKTIHNVVLHSLQR